MYKEKLKFEDIIIWLNKHKIIGDTLTGRLYRSKIIIQCIPNIFDDKPLYIFSYKELIDKVCGSNFIHNYLLKRTVENTQKK